MSTCLRLDHTDAVADGDPRVADRRTTLSSLSPELVVQIVDSCGSTFEERWHACVVLARVCTSTRAAVHAWTSAQTIASLCTRIEPPLAFHRYHHHSFLPTRVCAHLCALYARLCTFVMSQVSTPTRPPRWNVAVLATRCVALTHVTLADACDADVVALARHCPALAYVDVHECGKVTDVGVVALACGACAAHLRYLWVCNDAFSSTRDSITDLSLTELGRMCPNLEQLHMHRVRRWSPSSRTQITHAGIAALARGCPRLSHIDMSRLAVVRAGFDALAAHCDHLVYLNVAHCDHFDDVAASSIASAKCASSVRYLDLRSCASLTEAGIAQLTLKCSSLEHIEVWGKLGDDAIDTIAHNCSRTLRTLHFTSAILRNVGTLTHRCTHLRSLSLTTDQVWSLGFDPQCTLLEHLHADCRSLTDEGVESLLRSCTTLKSVNLLRCRFVTDHTITTLAQYHARTLQSLKLVGIPRLSDRGVVTLGLHCADLRELCIGFCERVSDAPIGALAIGCPHLSVLHMWYCAHPSYDATRTLQRARRRIEYLQQQQQQQQHKKAQGSHRVKWMSL